MPGERQEGKKKISDEEEVTLEFGERKNDGANRYSPSGDFIAKYPMRNL